MKKKKKKNLLITPALLFALSGVMLLLSTVGSARAALIYGSENYGMQISVPSIGVTLLENGSKVENNGFLLTGMLKNGETLELGKTYTEELSVQNSGEIGCYVRVILYKNWTKDGETVADTELSPDLIDLQLTGSGDWMKDESASTKERTVLYYKKIVPSGETITFGTGLRIDPSVASKMTKTTRSVPGGTEVTTAFAYDGYRFNVKAEVNAVQTHSAVGAIKSAWGVDAEVAGDGTLTRIGSAGSGESDLNEQP